ncbi:single-stranded DNA-binding protein [Erysipelothrix sp. HDW6A]|uniref:single-stranded DNA-binding protein n=1 Tax=Erysipelothrix sp. HDW6A TaxID=2714928 RepID=UPI00140E7629|nr:single-stranded DNA-binding protein [Erysipelothrix sp. HDW6A]QIK56652.1 single-stranded DNA-binding protein [Erysipelothrix sp. HDW6A]
MINRSVLVGRLTRDPELRKTQTGKSVVSFTLAVNRKFSKEEQADFINCVAWNQTADFIANYLTKGALISVEGSIQSRTYDDNTGKRVYVQEVVSESVNALESLTQRQEREQQTQSYQSSGYKQDTESNYVEDEPVLLIDETDLPF